MARSNAGRVANKVALITGAARGVGLADARLLVAEGARVIMTDLNVAAGTAAADEIGAAARFVQQDVADETGWISLLQMIEADFGRLDILVNNAAILAMKNIEDETLAGWQRIQSVNQDSVFLGIKHALPLMTLSGGGSIINMSSSSALMGLPNFVAYSASKAAVRGLTQTVAVYCHEQKNRVRCNSIHPDGINTAMVAELQDVPKNAMSDAQALRAFSYMSEATDIAQVVLFLASDDSSSINGAAIRADKSASYTPPYA